MNIKIKSTIDSLKNIISISFYIMKSFPISMKL